MVPGGTGKTSLGHNPRRIKRLINDYNFMNDLATNRYAGEENPIDSENLLRWLIMETIYTGFARLVRERSLAYVGEIKKSLQQLEGKMSEEEKIGWRVSDDKIKEVGAADMALYLQDRNFVDIIRDFPSEEEKIRQLMRFTEAIKSVEEETASSVRETGFDIYTKIIPGGRFKIEGTSKKVEI